LRACQVTLVGRLPARAQLAGLRDDVPVTQWEYARLEYASTGSFGKDSKMDWDATFHHGGGVRRWGTDERFDDLRHLNRAGREGWQVYGRAALLVGQPHRLHSVTYSMYRPVA
jgi:hypothetical protein